MIIKYKVEKIFLNYFKNLDRKEEEEEEDKMMTKKRKTYSFYIKSVRYLII
jgi:hypothetical protein